MATTPKYEIGILDDAGVLKDVREVEESEWVTSIHLRKVQLPLGHDLRERIGKFYYSPNKGSWLPRRDPNPLMLPIDWAELRRDALSNAVPPPEWPKGVRPISIEGTTLFGLDEDLNLFWDGRAVEIRKRVSLSLWQNTLAAITAFSAGIVAVVEVVSLIKEMPEVMTPLFAIMNVLNSFPVTSAPV